VDEEVKNITKKKLLINLVRDLLYHVTSVLTRKRWSYRHSEENFVWKHGCKCKKLKNF